MLGIGGFSPLNGFMTKADWKAFVLITSLQTEPSGLFPSCLTPQRPMQTVSRLATRSPLRETCEAFATMKVPKNLQ